MSALKPASVIIPCTILAVLLILCLATSADHALFLSINQFSQILPERLWQTLSTLSDPLVGCLLIFTLFYKHPALLRALLIAATLGVICNYALKYGFGFPRPGAVLANRSFIEIGPPIPSPSFPSGHTLTAFLLMSLVGHWTGAKGWLSALFLIACLMALSRIAVGAHWPSDVLFGALLGWAIGWLALQINQHFNKELPPTLALSIYFLGLFIGIYALIGKTPYPMGQWLSTAIALFTIAYSLKSITKRLHRQKG